MTSQIYKLSIYKTNRIQICNIYLILFDENFHQMNMVRVLGQSLCGYKLLFKMSPVMITVYATIKLKKNATTQEKMSRD
jgi:hypothetical protein